MRAKRKKQKPKKKDISQLIEAFEPLMSPLSPHLEACV